MISYLYACLTYSYNLQSMFNNFNIKIWLHIYDNINDFLWDIIVIGYRNNIIITIIKLVKKHLIIS